MASKCKECGCVCSRCIRSDRRHSDMHLHAEIENLRQRLIERDSHIVTMETQFLNEADKFPNGELASLKDEIRIWQEKYDRLFDAHKRVQKVNQNLEDKLLKLVDKCETEKGAFSKDIATLSHRLADANYTIHRLTQDNDRYRKDLCLALQLLQCKPSNFVGQKYESLPSEVQAKVRTYIAQKGPTSDPKSSDVKSITVPISTFPPTAMVYNVTRASCPKKEELNLDDPKPPVDVVSAAIMVKVLEDREKERNFARHCDTCTCHRNVLRVDSEVQTMNNFETCNECQNRQGSSRGDDFAEDGDRGTKRKDRFKFDRTAKQHKEIRDSYSHSIFPEVNDYSKTISKVRTQNSDNSMRHTSYQCVNEVAESKNNQKSESFKSTSRSIGARSYSSFRSSTKHQNSQNTQSITAETKLLAPENFEGQQEEKADSVNESKKHDNWNDVEKTLMIGRAAQVDIINDRLWKSSWKKSESLNFRDPGVDRRIHSEKDMHIGVINERVWKNNKSKTKEAKPTQMTLIEVASADEVTNSETRPAESTVSPSFSSDSVIFSTSDPSSISSDVVHLTGKSLSKQEKKNCNTDLKASKQERTPTSRNCVIKFPSRSNNILLDNVGNYQPILYANAVGFPNTALVHASSSCRSGRTASTSSEENSSILTPDNVQLQRVAEWVKSSVQLDKSSVRSDKSSVSGPKHSDKVLRVETPRIESKNLVDELKLSESVEKDVKKKEKDLITFDPSSDEERDAKVVQKDLSKADSNLNVHDDFKVTKEMEETYLTLTASLNPALRLPTSPGRDLTIENYRKDHKRLQPQKVATKSGSPT